MLLKNIKSIENFFYIIQYTLYSHIITFTLCQQEVIDVPDEPSYGSNSALVGYEGGGGGGSYSGAPDEESTGRIIIGANTPFLKAGPDSESNLQRIEE